VDVGAILLQTTEGGFARIASRTPIDVYIAIFVVNI
jgi:hypothetical protein